MGVVGLMRAVEQDVRYELERPAPDGGNHRGGADLARDLAPHIVSAVLTEQVALFTLIPLADKPARAEGTLQAVVALEPLGICLRERTNALQGCSSVSHRTGGEVRNERRTVRRR